MLIRCPLRQETLRADLLMDDDPYADEGAVWVVVHDVDRTRFLLSEFQAMFFDVVEATPLERLALEAAGYDFLDGLPGHGAAGYPVCYSRN